MSPQLILAPPRSDPDDLALRPGEPLRNGGGSGSLAVTDTGFEVRRSTQGDLIDLSLSLADEFAGRVPAGTVIRIVGQARERLLATGVRGGLVVAVESMARARLGRLSLLGTAPSDTEAPAPHEPAHTSITRGRMS